MGSVGSAVTYLAGFLAGIVADRFGFRLTAMTGSVVMTVALILASFSTQVMICPQFAPIVFVLFEYKAIMS